MGSRQNKNVFSFDLAAVGRPERPVRIFTDITSQAFGEIGKRMAVRSNSVRAGFP